MKKWFSIIIIFALFLPISPVFAVLSNTNVNLDVSEQPTCNNNGICESSLGENSTNCPLDCPAPTPAGTVLLPDTTPPVIYNLFISKITLNSATIDWETNENSFCQLFWGKTSEYQEGIISEITFYLKHSTALTNLSPETDYRFKIKCQDTNGNESETLEQKFTTLSPADITPPANVSNFEAIPKDSEITLKWQNPPDFDFKAVKIMRSEKFYPSDPWEGVPVYNDKGTSFVDTGLTNGLRYYYTGFAYDKAGNYASGVIASAVPLAPLPPGVPPPIVPPPPEILPPVVIPPPEVEKIGLLDFDFVQLEKKLSPTAEGKIEISSGESLKISIDYEKVPEVLKTLMVTLEKPGRLSGSIQKGEGRKFFSFLLRINKEKTAYEGVIMSPEPGVYPLTLTILDYKNQTLKKINGELFVAGISGPVASTMPWHKNPIFWKYLIYVLLALLVIYVLLHLRRKSKTLIPNL